MALAEAKGEVDVRSWVQQRMMAAAYMRDGEEDGRRNAGEQYQAHWAENCRRCPIRRNDNGSFNGSVSVSCIVAADKEPSRPAYRMRYDNSGSGVSTGLSDAGL